MIEFGANGIFDAMLKWDEGIVDQEDHGFTDPIPRIDEMHPRPQAPGLLICQSL